MQFTDLFQRGVSRPEPASYVATDVHSKFRFMMRALEKIPTSSFILFSLFSDALDLPQGAYLARPPATRGCRKWLSTDTYRALFTAFEIHPQDTICCFDY